MPHQLLSLLILQQRDEQHLIMTKAYPYITASPKGYRLHTFSDPDNTFIGTKRLRKSSRAGAHARGRPPLPWCTGTPAEAAGWVRRCLGPCQGGVPNLMI
jgi:hypothetical protein